MSAGSGHGSGRWRIVLLLLVIGTIALAGVVLLVRHDAHPKPGGEILWDDFGFSVVDIREEPAVGPASDRVMASGRFVIVTLRVANHAQRVEYRLDRHTPVLESADGSHYQVDARATELRRRETGAGTPPARLIAGSAHASEIVFDVPLSATGLELRISWGIDALDRIVLGDRSLLLGR